MTTKAELIKYLQTLPEDTHFCVIEVADRNTSVVPLEIDENTDFIDFTGNQFVKEHEKHYNQKYLTFGLEQWWKYDYG